MSGTTGKRDPGELIRRLASRIEGTLASVAGNGGECALIEFPNHPNVGDSAIWLGEVAWLRKSGFEVRYSCDVQTYDERMLRKRVGNSPIFLNGGGNMGDVWPAVQQFREEIIRAFPRNPIIQFPQSIHFESQEELRKTRSVLGRHPRLVLLARDGHSRAVAEEELGLDALLCPDMAFMLGRLRRPRLPTQEILWLSREDKEAAHEPSESPLANSLKTDWLARKEGASSLSWMFAYLAGPRLAGTLREHDYLRAVTAPLHARIHRVLARHHVKRGASILSRGAVVVTDRLHGHILGLLLGIPHVVRDNSNGKVRAFWESWTSVSDLAQWADSNDDALRRARALVSNMRAAHTAR